MEVGVHQLYDTESVCHANEVKVATTANQEKPDGHSDLIIQSSGDIVELLFANLGLDFCRHEVEMVLVHEILAPEHIVGDGVAQLGPRQVL